MYGSYVHNIHMNQYCQVGWGGERGIRREIGGDSHRGEVDTWAEELEPCRTWCDGSSLDSEKPHEMGLSIELSNRSDPP